MSQIIQYEQPVYSDPAFPIIFHQDQLSGARTSVYTNWHQGIELLYCYEGAAHMLLDSETASFREGELAVIGSNVIHAMHLDSEVCNYHCLIVEPDFLTAHGLNTEHICFEEVIRDPRALAIFEMVVDAYDAEGPYLKPAVMGAVLSLFVLLCRAHVKLGVLPDRNLEKKCPQVVMEALQYIRRHLCEPIAIDDICKHVGMSKYYFCRTFRAYTGTPVINYINMLRCDYARRLIVESGYNVSEAAYRLGITNLSYFSQLYKKHMGVLPSKARQQTRTDFIDVDIS